MGSEAVRIAASDWDRSDRAERRTTVSWPRLRAEHWIVAFWLLVGVLGYQSFTTAAPGHAVTALDGGITPPRTH